MCVSERDACPVAVFCLQVSFSYIIQRHNYNHNLPHLP